MKNLTGEHLGCDEFKLDYGIKYAYVAGAMVHAIASKEMVIRLGKAGLLGYFGTGGLSLDTIEQNLLYIKNALIDGGTYGMNLLNTVKDMQTVDLFLKHGVRNIEAAAYMTLSPAIIKFRLRGLIIGPDGRCVAQNRVLAKLSRPEVATKFLSPPPDRMVQQLLSEGHITEDQAALAKQVPLADDICVEADSGGHTDQRAAYSLIPTMLRARNQAMEEHQYEKKIRLGVAGGIGTPQAVAATFLMGADFVLTGSINQCTVEAGTSNIVKDMLQGMNIQDTAYAPAGDMFEIGARVQVVKKGTFFPVRANKLYDLYTNHKSIDDIDVSTQSVLQDKFFKQDFEHVYEKVKLHRSNTEISSAEQNPKKKMAYIFKWYFHHTNQIALAGLQSEKADFQVHSGSSMGAFNQWVTGTTMENWRDRHVDKIACEIMEEAASVIKFYYTRINSRNQDTV